MPRGSGHTDTQTIPKTNRSIADATRLRPTKKNPQIQIALSTLGPNGRRVSAKKKRADPQILKLRGGESLVCIHSEVWVLLQFYTKMGEGGGGSGGEKWFSGCTFLLTRSKIVVKCNINSSSSTSVDIKYKILLLLLLIHVLGNVPPHRYQPKGLIGTATLSFPSKACVPHDAPLEAGRETQLRFNLAFSEETHELDLCCDPPTEMPSWLLCMHGSVTRALAQHPPPDCADAMLSGRCA